MQRALFKFARPLRDFNRISRQWYELPPKQAPLPHLTVSEYLPGRPWREEVEGVVVAKELGGKVAVVVLGDETQVLGRYPRAIRPVYGPTVHPAKTFTPVPSFEPFPRVACLDAASSTEVGDRVHANRILGPFFLAAGTKKGDGVVQSSSPHPAFMRVRFEVDRIVNVNWETRARTARAGAPIPTPMVTTHPFENRNPTKDQAEENKLRTTRRLQIYREETSEEVWEGAQLVTALNATETGAKTNAEFQENRFDNPTQATKVALRRLAGPDIDIAPDLVHKRLVARRVAVDVTDDQDVL